MQTMSLIGKTVPRLGYGTMRLTGPNIMGPPEDHAEAVRVIKRAYELGVRVIDTAWYYGPDEANKILAEALHPYPNDLIIITKLGGKRDAAGNWLPALSADDLRAGMECDLQLLQIDSVPVVHLRWMDNLADEDFTAALDTMLTLQREGKFQHLGLSNVTEAQLDTALARTPVVTISNPYSVDNQADDALVMRCAEAGIAYLPFFPLAVGKADNHPVLQKWAQQLDATPSQVALAWLLKRSPTLLPIPGTSQVIHLEENYAAGELVLPDEAYRELTA